MNSISAKIDWRAAVLAGSAAGIATSAVQITLWWLFWDVLPEILYRDARLTAAIVMGQRVLPPPASFDATVIAVSAVTGGADDRPGVRGGVVRHQHVSFHRAVSVVRGGARLDHIGGPSRLRPLGRRLLPLVRRTAEPRRVAASLSR